MIQTEVARRIAAREGGLTPPLSELRLASRRLCEVHGLTYETLARDTEALCLLSMRIERRCREAPGSDNAIDRIEEGLPMMDRVKAPLFVFVAALLTATCGAPGPTRNAAPPPAQQRRPNIVMVLVDDMRWDEMRVAGHPFVDTPNMDRLAREGARFTNAFATTPLCSPSRASLLTGQYAHTNGIIDNTARPSHNLQVFPLELQRAGYRTGFFGKWHMGNDDSPRPGFDHWVAMPGQGEAIDPSLNVDGERVKAKGYTTDLLTDYVERFMDSPSDRPFLVYLAHKALHPNVVQRDDGSLGSVANQPGGFVAAERHRGRYVGRTMPRRANAFKPPLGKPALLRQIDRLPPLGPKTATSDEEIRGRLEMLLAVDDSLGGSSPPSSAKAC